MWNWKSEGTASDELNANLLQDSTLLYDDPRVYGPTSRTDARHSGSFSMVWLVKGCTVAPTYFYRSPLPVQTIQGRDANLNGENNDLPALAYRFTDVGQAPEEIGPCETWNCSRGAWRTQFNLRVSHGFALGRLGGGAHAPRVKVGAERGSRSRGYSCSVRGGLPVHERGGID